MSADLLRRAAAKAREVAEAARAGRWYTEGTQVLADWRTPRPVTNCDGSFVEQGNLANAAHIALWQPIVALAVADWLVNHAEEHVGSAGRNECPWIACPSFKVARLLLGES